MLVFKSIAGQVDLKSVPTASPPLLDLSEFFEPIIKEAEAQIRFQAPVGGNHQKISEYMTKICKNEKVLSTDVYQK